MSDTTVPVAGIATPAPEVSVATPAELTELLSQARSSSTIEIVHEGGPFGKSVLVIPLTPVEVDVSRGIITAGMPATPKMLTEKIAEAGKGTGLDTTERK